MAAASIYKIINGVKTKFVRKDGGWVKASKATTPKPKIKPLSAKKRAEKLATKQKEQAATTTRKSSNRYKKIAAASTIGTGVALVANGNLPKAGDKKKKAEEPKKTEAKKKSISEKKKPTNSGKKRSSKNVSTSDFITQDILDRAMRKKHKKK